MFVQSGQVVPQAPWREWNDELKATVNQGWQAWGQNHLLQAGYEHRQEKLSRAHV